ncbi:hypothetical protein H257_15788 [Aphanomyces astaci]|uniref:DDE Tnp4 domain-containing protein n=1 Tax=Aphanomyces astaci TaxID=112090 RepID=W4FN06_APHAT|nr:hypothetical protein H257_15788 [Aphanomyces astaci]ETV68209.1 hypothetical protein H257_15788 [Aphanomyces astaci]|eukprot:XP_009842294.1 hypothetical protein H257_15788 [Aphanomyces astaci]
MEGRNRRSPTSPKDAMFKALTVLKHFSSWEKHAADYGFEAPTFEKLIMRRFAHFLYALYAVDVKFQPSNLPAGRFAEQKHYFSGKHHLYGYKIETAVSPDGRCVAMSTADAGSVHDLTIMNSRHHSLLPDHGEQDAQHRGSWACLVDMGYNGISNSLRSIHPKRRPAHGSLDASDLERYANVSSDRVIVENFFIPVCSLWRVSCAT